MSSILGDAFVTSYADRKVDWGFASGPNSIGEITYRRTYSRDGERWHETVARSVEGCWDALRQHCTRYNLPFDLGRARDSAQEMFDRCFRFKWTPPGRGLWINGTPFVRERGAAALNNCAFVSTVNLADDVTKPFRFLMDMSMLGVGVGFDTLGAGKQVWVARKGAGVAHVVDDSREGWVDSLGALLRWAFGYGPLPVFDYSFVRPAGAAIKGFGGTASGPGPLRDLHLAVYQIAVRRRGRLITSRDIVDVMNLIGRCVVAGNVRRTAELALGTAGDREFLSLKDYAKNPERAEFGWTSNNSVVDPDEDDDEELGRLNAINGEPGVFWLRNAQMYGRFADPRNDKDRRATGANPCVEQTLESYELCCLVETFLNRAESRKDWLRTLKFAYLYAKSVTLLPTHWPETNAVMMRNRRIGASVSGVAQFLAAESPTTLAKWLNEGYKETGKYDEIYSEWLGVRESIKRTSVKPSGTVSLLAGATPGCHYPTHRYYLRRIRFAASHPDLPAVRAAGYHVEPAAHDPNTMVVSFPVAGPQVPTEREKTVEQKMEVAELLQHWWADNQVSATFTFDPATEGAKLPALLKRSRKSLKSASFLPLVEHGAYAQMPYEAITEQQYLDMVRDLGPIEWSARDTHAVTEKFCDGDTCTTGA